MDFKISFRTLFTSLILIIFLLVYILYNRKSEHKKIDSIITSEEESELKYEIESSLPDFKSEELTQETSVSLEVPEPEDSMHFIPSIVDVPFRHWIIEKYESLKENLFTPNPDPSHIEIVKNFHSRLESLEAKEKEGLSPLETEEFQELKLRKMKDRKEIMTLTLEKHNEAFSPKQKKLFQEELDQLKDQIDWQESQRK